MGNQLRLAHIPCNLVAQFHVAKQHLGFVMLYKRKTGERSDVMLDKRFIVISLMLPWALYVYRLLDIPGTQQAALWWLYCCWLSCMPVRSFLFDASDRKSAPGEVCNFPKLLLCQ